LKIQRLAGNAALSWPLFAVDYSLQEATNPAVVLQWQTKQSALSTNADGLITTVPAGNSASLFRLSKP